MLKIRRIDDEMHDAHSKIAQSRIRMAQHAMPGSDSSVLDGKYSNL